MVLIVFLINISTVYYSLCVSVIIIFLCVLYCCFVHVITLIKFVLLRFVFMMGYNNGGCVMGQVDEGLRKDY